VPEKNQPRLTPAHIEACIASEHYFTALQGQRMAGQDAIEQTGSLQPWVGPLEPELGLLTFCVLVLRNGFKVTGESACASPELFDAEKGRSAARATALAKTWPLEGYALKQRIHDAANQIDCRGVTREQATDKSRNYG
jgi:hypothetical protein